MTITSSHLKSIGFIKNKIKKKNGIEISSNYYCVLAYHETQYFDFICEILAKFEHLFLVKFGKYLESHCILTG